MIKLPGIRNNLLEAHLSLTTCTKFAQNFTLSDTVSLMQLRLSHGKSQSIWQKPTTWQKSECLGFVIGWPLPVYSGKTQGGYKK